MITKEQAIAAAASGERLHSGDCVKLDKPRAWRPNGRCQTWITLTEDFVLPLKRGIYDYSAVFFRAAKDGNAHLFHLESECPLTKGGAAMTVDEFFEQLEKTPRAWIVRHDGAIRTRDNWHTPVSAVVVLRGEPDARSLSIFEGMSIGLTRQDAHVIAIASDLADATPLRIRLLKACDLNAEPCLVCQHAGSHKLGCPAAAAEGTQVDQ